MTRAPGFYPNVPEGEYHADPALSSTGLRKVLTTPAHFRAYTQEEQRDTPALLLGRAVHCAVLEPERYARDYAPAPEVDRRTKAGKATWEQFQADHPHATILKADDAATVEAMAQAVREHPTAALLLTEGEPELSAWWEDPETGVPCRARFDWLRRGDALGVDLKTAQDAGPRAFERAIQTHGYHVQAAFYSAGFQAIAGEPLRDFAFICVEKAPPFAVACYRLDDAAMDEGHRRVREGLRRYAECLERGEWPGYPTEIQSITLPRWGFDNEEPTA